MKKLVDFEFFEEGDYRHKNPALDNGKWTEADFKKAHAYLQAINKGIPVILNPKDAHETEDKDNVAVLGRIKEIWRKPNGVWSGNGEFLEEVADIIEKKMYDGKSIGITRMKNGDIVIDHIALCGAQRAYLEHLKPNSQSIFDSSRLKKLTQVQLFSSQSEGDENIEIDFRLSGGESDNDSSANQGNEEGNQSGDSKKTKTKKKETKTMSDYTEADVKLKVREATDAQIKESQRDADDIKRKFTLTIEGKDTEIGKKDKDIDAKNNEITLLKDTIKDKDEEIKGFTTTIADKDTEIKTLKTNFAKREEDNVKREVGYFVHNCSAIPPVEKPAKFKMLFTIRQQSKEAYEDMKKIIGGSGNPLAFGLDKNFTTGSGEYSEIVKEFSDNSGNVGLEIDMTALSDEALKVLEQ